MPRSKKSFTATIEIIGVNPFVYLPENILEHLFIQSKKNKGPIPVKGTINGKPYIQTLVKFAGHWRLYLNLLMRKAAGIDVGDQGIFTVTFDPVPRKLPMHDDLAKALKKNTSARIVFAALSPYRQKEIVRYIHHLKSDISVKKNIQKIILHLNGKGRFAGRD